MSDPAEIHASEDRLIDLVQGLLLPPERDATLRHLKSCGACEERFRTVGREAEILRMRAVRPAISSALPDAALGIESEGPPRVATIIGTRVIGADARPKRRRIWAGVAVAAAAMLIAAAVVWPLLRSRSQERSDRNASRAASNLDYWLPVEAEQVMLRSGADVDENGELLEAVEAYRRHDSARVVELLANRPFSEHDSFTLILASALVWQGRNTEARDLLVRWNVDLLPPPFRDRGRWILYAARKRLGEDEAASAIARQLAVRPGEFQERAKRALTNEDR